MLLINLWLPVVSDAQVTPSATAPPAIAQQLVREGDFALKLALALGVGAPTTEAEAESLLADVDIMPKNGWLADYPVTPDIVAELSKAVQDSAAAKKIPLASDVALQKFATVLAQSKLQITPAPVTETAPAQPLEVQEKASYARAPEVTQEYPNQTVIENYYQSAGPPIVTYYTPPVAYYNLYGWVPSPFWCAGFWFPGFFILNNFHHAVFYDNHRFFVSNHFHDNFRGRFYRVNPVDRFHGRTFDRDFISSGRNQGRQSIGLRSGNFQATRTNRDFSTFRGRDAVIGSRSSQTSNRGSALSSGMPSRSRSGSIGIGSISREVSLPTSSGRSFNTAPITSRSFRVSTNNTRNFSMPSNHSSGRNFNMPSSSGSGRSFSRPSSSGGGGRSFSMPSSSGRGFSSSSRSGGSLQSSFRGGGGSGGRGSR
jgi:hypothetical protein